MPLPMLQREIHLKIGFSVILSILLLCVSIRSGSAQTPDEEMTFRRLGISRVENGVGKKEGQGIDGSVEKAVRDALRFEAVRVKALIRFPGKRDDIQAQGLKLQLDLILTGKIQRAGRKVKLTLALFEAKTGKLFALEHGLYDPKTDNSNWDDSVSELFSKLTGRIPYRAIVTQQDGGDIRINSGRLSGILMGDVLDVMEILEIQRHPFTGEAIGFKTETLGRLRVVETQDLSSMAMVIQIKRGKSIRIGSKVVYQLSTEALSRAKKLKKAYFERKTTEEKKPVSIFKERPAGPAPMANRIQVAVGTGLAENFFRFDSNELDFKRRTTTLTAIQIRGIAWLIRSLGVGISFRQGYMNFNEIDGGSINVDSTARWLDGGVVYRFRLSPEDNGPAILLGGGYHQYRFDVNKPDDTFFNDYTLSGPFIGVGGDFPVFGPMGLRGGLMGFPALDYRESGVDSGRNSKGSGYLIRAGGYYTLSDLFGVELLYELERYHSEFSGTGTRGASGVTGSRVTESYNGIILNLTGSF